MKAEGWYVDPFGVHEARWISDGSPTALVRDGGTESHDAPVQATYDGPLIPIGSENEGAGESGDQLRADSDEGPFDPQAGSRAAWDAFDQLPKP